MGSNRNRMIVVVLLALVGGCAASQEARRAEGPPSSVHYYVGDRSVTISNGREVAGARVFLRRTLDPATGTIEENVVDVNTEDSTWNEYTVVMTVSGNTFTIRESSGGFDGEGTLEGEAWRWTTWRSLSRASGGNTIESVDRLEVKGLRTEKIVTASDGRFVVKVTAALSEVSQGEFEQEKRERALPLKRSR